jgi:hypothetical protein
MAPLGALPLAALAAAAVGACSPELTPFVQEADPGGTGYAAAIAGAAAYVERLELEGDMRVTRYHVVRVDAAAASRLLEFAMSGETHLDESFDLSLFAESSCTLSTIQEARALQSGRWRNVAACDEDDHDLARARMRERVVQPLQVELSTDPVRTHELFGCL